MVDAAERQGEGTEEHSPAPIYEAVGLLASRAPSALRELEAKFPEGRELLQPGQIAGPSSMMLQMRIAVSRRALREAIALSEEGMRVGQERLSRVRSLELVGQIMALLGSGGVLGTLSSALAAKSAGFPTYAAATIAFIGALAGTVGQHLSRGINAQGGGLLEHYTTLVEARPEARELDETLRIWSESQADLGEKEAEAIEGAIGRTNALCARVYKSARMVPGVVVGAQV